MGDTLREAGLSRSRIDRLGEALRHGETDDDDLRLLGRYRGLFPAALHHVVATVHEIVEIEVSDRQKTMRSIVAKLRRERTRLSRMQDIAGCRVVLPDLAAQEAFCTKLAEIRPSWSLVDRRMQPSHRYRAVHVIADVDGLRVELQVRTSLQHVWAEMSEALDRIWEGIKYGQGPAQLLQILHSFGESVEDLESMEAELVAMEQRVDPQFAERWPLFYAAVAAGKRPKLSKKAAEIVKAVGPEPAGFERRLGDIKASLTEPRSTLLSMMNAVVSAVAETLPPAGDPEQ